MSEISYDVQAFRSIGVRTVDENGVVHRRVVVPGSDISGEAKELIALAAELWTPKVLAEWEAHVRANEPPPPPLPDRVSARQFKLQLLAEGLLEQVDAWVASQGKAIQLAYDNSNEFVRDEPMMQAGFAALKFPPEQVLAFFSAASKR
jgi:hypothetical protein